MDLGQLLAGQNIPGLGMVWGTKFLNGVHNLDMFQGPQKCELVQYLTCKIWSLGYMLHGFSKVLFNFCIYSPRILTSAFTKTVFLSTFAGIELTTNILPYTLFLFSRSSVASNPMQSSSSPTQMAWSFWCAMKMKGFM